MKNIKISIDEKIDKDLLKNLNSIVDKEKYEKGVNNLWIYRQIFKVGVEKFYSTEQTKEVTQPKIPVVKKPAKVKVEPVVEIETKPELQKAELYNSEEIQSVLDAIDNDPENKEEFKLNPALLHSDEIQTEDFVVTESEKIISPLNNNVAPLIESIKQSLETKPEATNLEIFKLNPPVDKPISRKKAAQKHENCTLTRETANTIDLRTKEKLTDYEELLIFAEDNLPCVSKLKFFTEKEFNICVEKYGKEMVYDVLTGMENYQPLLKNYRSAYMTCNNWCIKRVNDPAQHEKRENLKTRKTLYEQITGENADGSSPDICQQFIGAKE